MEVALYSLCILRAIKASLHTKVHIHMFHLGQPIRCKRTTFIQNTCYFALSNLWLFIWDLGLCFGMKIFRNK